MKIIKTPTVLLSPAPDTPRNKGHVWMLSWFAAKWGQCPGCARGHPGLGLLGQLQSSLCWSSQGQHGEWAQELIQGINSHFLCVFFVREGLFLAGWVPWANAWSIHNEGGGPRKRAGPAAKNHIPAPLCTGAAATSAVPGLWAASVLRESLPSLWKVIKRRKMTWNNFFSLVL